MKKILSLVLIFVLSLTFAGITQEVKAAEGDVTIYFHVNQYDGDYTNTGVGIWDGVNWNNWADTVDGNTDAFGGIITKVYSAAEIAAVMDSVEFKPTRDVNVDDSMNYLAPGSGQVFVDVTSLKDGSETELHVYYVEGAEDAYVSEGLGAIFITYIDPKIASDETAYDGWNMWTWNNGTGGSDAGTDGLPFAMDMTVKGMVGDDNYEMPMKLVILEVGADADQDSGFIVRTADWAKQCGSDIMIDNTSVRGSGALMYYYHAQSCDLETDGAQYLSDISEMYKQGLKNKFIMGTQITNNQTIEITMFSSKASYTLLPERFMVKDANGDEVAITGYDIPGVELGMYSSDVVIESQTHVVVFVDTVEDHTKLGLVGSIQGWNPGAAITTLGDDMNGYAVFEFTTYDAEAQFKFLFDNDDNGFNWGDAELIGSNAVIDLSAGGTIEVYYDDANDVVKVVDNAPEVVDETLYTYTSAVTCNAGENLFTLFLDTELDSTKIGVVGSIQVNDWTPSEAILASDVTAEGLVVFEVCMTDVNVEYKVLYHPTEDDPLTLDVDESEFAWGDRELVTSNVVVDFGEGTTDGVISHLIDGEITKLGDYVTTMSAESTYLLSVYLLGEVPVDKIGIVGTINGWDVANPIMPTKVDAFGNMVFDIAVTSKTGEYLVVYDADDDGFDWDDKISGNDNIPFDLGSPSNLIQLAEINADMSMTFTDIGDSLLEYNKTATMSLTFPEGTFVYGEEYTIYYVETIGTVVAESNQVLEGTFDDGTFEESVWVSWLGDQWSGETQSVVTIEGGELVVDVIFTGTPQSYATQIYQEGFAVENGSYYRISFDARADEAKDILVAFGDALDWDPWFTDYNPKQTVSLTTDMQTFVLDFQMMQPTTADQGKLVFELATAVNTKVYIDNVMLEEITSIPEDMDIEEEVIMYELPFNVPLFFGDPIPVEGLGTYAITPTEIQVDLNTQRGPLDGMLSFEDSVWMAWYGDQWSGETQSVVSIVDEMLMVDVIFEGTPATYATQVYQEGFKVENGKFYRISFDAKAGEAKDLIVAFGDALDYDPWFTDYAPKTTFNLTTAMQTFTLEFEMTEATTMDQGKLVFELATAVNTMVTIDNVMLEEIDALAGTAVADTDQVIQGGFDTPYYQLVLKDENGAVVPFETYGYGPSAGTYETDKRCHSDQDLILVHIRLTNTVIDSLDQLGIVGTINGWDIGNAIKAKGMDSNGNYVFEVCISDTDTGGEFKVKFDMDSDGFTWDGTTDPELTPGNVVFSVADGPHYFVEEGSSALDISMTHMITLSGANALDNTKEYTLEFMDENGFVIYIPVDMDTQAPVVDYAVIPDVEFILNTTDTFDLMDFYTKLQFLDNREGELAYEIVTNIDLTTPGAQTVTVKATDMWDNETVFNINFTVVAEIVLPTITGDATVTLQADSTEPAWADYVTVTGGTLTINDSQVDMANNGVFYVIFTVENDNGDTATHTLEVTIEGATEANLDSGCFGSIGFGSSIVIAIAALGGAVIFFVRKR
jgi:hypothetical protein